MGVFNSPDGSMKDQSETSGDKLDRWATLIVNGYLHRRLVWKAFWGTIWHTTA